MQQSEQPNKGTFNIWASDIPAVYEQSTLQMKKGNTWLAVNDSFDYVKQMDIKFFSDQRQSEQFCERTVSEIEHYRSIPIAPLLDALHTILFRPDEAKQRYPIDENWTCYHIDLSKNELTMNERNYEFLVNQIRGTGFGDNLAEELKQRIAKGETDFTLHHQQDYGKDSTVATLHFSKSDKSDMYFFNRYTMALHKNGQDEIIKQTYLINHRSDNITRKEAYNLLRGAAVYKEITPKEGSKFNAWLQLDFKQTDKHDNFMVRQFHPKWGYELQATLAKFPIKELGLPEQQQRLMDSLERGNTQQVTLVVDGKETKAFIEASPQFKSINLFDASMKRTNLQQLREGVGEKQSTAQSQTKSSKQSLNEEGSHEASPAKKKTRKSPKL